MKAIWKVFGLGVGTSLLCWGCGAGFSIVSLVSPNISQVSPQVVTAGTPSVTLTVTGSNFDAQSAVVLNGAAVPTNVVNSSTLAAQVGGSALAQPTVAQLMVRNSNGIDSNSVDLTVAEEQQKAAALSIVTATLPSVQAGTAYSATLSATGGTPAYSWSIAAGNLPAGMTLSSAGVISGTPTASGTATFTVQVTDSGSPAQKQTASLSITVEPVVVQPSSLTITSESLGGGQVGVSYSATLSATGGTPAYSWSIAAGNLPAGLTLSSAGVISGTPTASGTFNFTVEVSDSGSPAQTQKMTASISVEASKLTISSSTLAAAKDGSSYKASLSATGGTPAYSWSIAAGNLPAGLTLSSAGVISGTPTASGTFNFTVEVSDSGSPAQTQTANLSLAVSATTLTIASSSLASGTSGASYNATLSASGGTPGYTWSIASGSLPAGLTLSSGGVISGTPTASGTAKFTVQVTDSGSPAQAASVLDSITISTAALAISASNLPAGQDGSTYAASLQAVGGTPGYTWSVASGNLPAGLTLSSAGAISGTPTGTGTSNFTIEVTDSGSPAQSQNVSLSITVDAQTSSTPGTTWYIRADGGTRYSANNPTGQCDGQADAPYGGSGVDQHCAFNDVRWLWDDHEYNKLQWVISGGDTVIIDNTKQWRIGFDEDGTDLSAEPWCYGWNGGPYGCFNPTIPSGTATQPTRILGRNYASCSAGNQPDKAQMTQIFGGHGVDTALNLDGAQHVEVECLEITRHSQCVVHGVPAYPSGCNTSPPIDDYDGDGITTDVNTHDVLLQDMWIHGHTDRGIIGPIGGLVTANRIDIDTNGMAGWDFDDGNGTPSVNAVLKMSYSTVEWSGCDQEYPAVDPHPVISCYSQSTGGYGDGIGTPASDGMSVYIDHSIFRYNTQDGEDFGHIDTGSNTFSMTDSISYANNGGQFKWGQGFSSVLFENNIALGNCLRMSQAIPGAPSSFNTNLSDFCRANDAISFDVPQGGNILMANNTFVSYAPTTFDIQCDVASCSNTTMTFENNIVRGYDNPTTYDMGGQPGGPGGFCGAGCNGSTQLLGKFIRSNNMYYGIRGSCIANQPMDAVIESASNESCPDPDFVNEPASFIDEATLDNFNFSLAGGSPATGSGIPVSGLTMDFDGNAWSVPPSMGALEMGSVEIEP